MSLYWKGDLFLSIQIFQYIVIISFVEKNVSYKHKNIFIAIYSYEQNKHISLLHLLKTDICA